MAYSVLFELIQIIKLKHVFNKVYIFKFVKTKTLTL